VTEVFISTVDIESLKVLKGDLLPEPWGNKPYFISLKKIHGADAFTEMSISEISRHLENEDRLVVENAQLRLRVSNLEMQVLGLPEDVVGSGAAPSEIIIQTGKKGRPRKVRISPKIIK
jgi:hypothetical protein